MAETRKLLYRVPEAADQIGVSRSRLYELLAAGQIESVTCGRTRLIPRDALETFVARLRQSDPQSAA